MRLLPPEFAPGEHDSADGGTPPGSVAGGEPRFRTLIEQAADGIFVTDAEGRFVLANSRMCLLLGYEPDEILDLNVLDTYLPDEREVGRQFLSRLSVGTTFRFERLLMRKDGSAFPIEASVAWLPGGERQTIVRDMTARKRAEEARRMDERRLRALVRLSELEAGSLGDLLDAALDEICALTRSPLGFVATYDEEASALLVRARPADAAAPAIRLALADAGLLGSPILERRSIVLNAPTPAETSARLDWPPIARFLAIPVRSRGRVAGSVGVANRPADYGDDDVRQLAQMVDVVWRIAERQQAEDELRSLNEVLEERVVQRTAEFEAANTRLEAANAELGAANGKLEAANRQLQAVLREQESLQAELAYRALHDPLTGLGNRRLFSQRLDYALEQTRRGVAVLWIDLDRFKQINDIFGHDVGDEVLLAVGDRLRDVLRTTDDVARMGGDEFAIVLPNVYEADAPAVARRVLDALTDPGAFRLRVGASVGVAWSPPGSGDGKALVRTADLAMYRAKASGGGLVVA